MVNGIGMIIYVTLSIDCEEVHGVTVIVTLVQIKRDDS